MNTFNPLISRLIAPFIAAFVIWLADLGLNIDTEFTETLSLVVAAVLMALYGLIHKLIDKKVNPKDVAKPPS